MVCWDLKNVIIRVSSQSLCLIFEWKLTLTSLSSFKMYLTTLLSVVVAATSTHALPQAPAEAKTKSRPPAFFLAGDSTTAIQSWNGGGWGDGFLATLRDDKGAIGINYGHNGATTVSFNGQLSNDSDWTWVLQSIKNWRHSHDPFVTIQVGFSMSLQA